MCLIASVRYRNILMVFHQQVVSVAPCGLLEFFLVHTKLERLPRQLRVFPGHLYLHERENAARC